MADKKKIRMEKYFSLIHHVATVESSTYIHIHTDPPTYIQPCTCLNTNVQLRNKAVSTYAQ